MAKCHGFRQKPAYVVSIFPSKQLKQTKKSKATEHYQCPSWDRKPQENPLYFATVPRAGEHHLHYFDKGRMSTRNSIDGLHSSISSADRLWIHNCLAAKAAPTSPRNIVSAP